MAGRIRTQLAARLQEQIPNSVVPPKDVRTGGRRGSTPGYIHSWFAMITINNQYYYVYSYDTMRDCLRGFTVERTREGYEVTAKNSRWNKKPT